MNRIASVSASRLLTRIEVEQLTALSTSSIYRAMRQADFPEPLRVSQRSVRWRSDEIAAWIDRRPRAAGIGPHAS